MGDFSDARRSSEYARRSGANAGNEALACNADIESDDNKVDIPEENENEVGGEENEEQVYVVENPSLDLEATSNAYTGLAKLYRLQFIAEHCPCYRVEALKLAIG